MTVTPGIRLGPYEVVSPLGKGGMGEVWRARDTRLDRDVAIKMLPAEFADDAELKIRFEREARSISRLSHPHICTLFDVGEQDGRAYLVMELLEGESLASRIARGPLPVEDVIRYGVQIADALDRAHRAGIVHRDLKPANVMITRSGAKLLDFGLAKESLAMIPRDAPTQQLDVTREGTIVGTFQYMAPEQLGGEAADARSDLFALGAVLYEMVTGRRAFEGNTRVSVIASILTTTPSSVATVRPAIPAALDHVIATCLRKDPDMRWQCARDVATELAWIGGTPAAAAPAAKPRGRAAFVIAAVLFATIAAAAGVAYVRELRKPSASVAFSLIPPRGTMFASAPVIAPNGRAIAFATRDDTAQRTLWVRRTGSASATKLTTAPRFRDLFWSPDSRSIGYFDAGKLMRIAADGGQPELIASFYGYGAGAAWSASGDIVFAPRFGAGLYRVKSSGGDPVPITTLDVRRHETLHGHPHFVGDSSEFVYLVRTLPDAPNEVFVGSLADPKLHRPIAKADSVIGYRDGWLFTGRNGAMYAQRLDAKTLALHGDPRKVLDDISYDEQSAGSFASVADDGAIVDLPPASQIADFDFGWYDEGGRLQQTLFTAKGSIELEEVAQNARRTTSAELSPDDAKVAIIVADPQKEAGDVFVRDLTRGITTRLTSGRADNAQACWAPGGTVVFSSDRGDAYDIVAEAEDGLTPPRVVWAGAVDKRPLSVSPDGATLLAKTFSPATKADIWTVPLHGGAPRPLIATEGFDDDARFSPDGQWIVYESDRSGRAEAYVKPFPDGPSFQISTDGGIAADWDRSGSRVIFTNGNTLYAVTVQRSGATATIAKPVALFTMPKTMTGCWPSRTADRFLCRTLADPREAVSVANYTKGWADALR